MGLPETWVQALVVLAAVTPGFVYQITRRALRGPHPDEASVSIRILRSIATSAVFVALYVLTTGTWLVDLLVDPTIAVDSPRVAAAVVLAGVLVVPWAAAQALFQIRISRSWLNGIARLQKLLHLRTGYDPTPSAWDFAFRSAEPRWVRVRTTDGRWIGGLFDEESFATSYPEDKELFLSQTFVMTDDGQFTDTVAAESGAWMSHQTISLIDFLPLRPTTEPGE